MYGIREKFLHKFGNEFADEFIHEEKIHAQFDAQILHF